MASQPMQARQYGFIKKPEKDIGAENPETTTVSGFFHADF